MTVITNLGLSTGLVLKAEVDPLLIFEGRLLLGPVYINSNLECWFGPLGLSLEDEEEAFSAKW